MLGIFSKNPEKANKNEVKHSKKVKFYDDLEGWEGTLKGGDICIHKLIYFVV